MAAGIATPDLERVTEKSVRWVRKRPIKFAEFVQMAGPKDFVELVNGSIVEKPMVQWNHGMLEDWLCSLLRTIAERRGLGAVASSRIAVETGVFGGRLPDILFIRRDRMDIVRPKGVFGAPDLVIEIVSPSNSKSDLIALETEYRSIGVTEIVFIDPHKRRIRVVRKREDDYKDEEITTGTLRLESMGSILFETAWLFDAPQPPLDDTLNRLMQTT